MSTTIISNEQYRGQGLRVQDSGYDLRLWERLIPTNRQQCAVLAAELAIAGFSFVLAISILWSGSGQRWRFLAVDASAADVHASSGFLD